MTAAAKSQHTPTPWKIAQTFSLNEMRTLAALKKEPEPSDGEQYTRRNDGGWVIRAAECGIADVHFRGVSKRGHAYRAPDPEGLANARLIVTAVNAHEALVAALRVADVALSPNLLAEEKNAPALKQIRAALALAEVKP